MSTVDLRNGDCLDILKTLPDNSVDAVVTDPPYGLSNTNPSQVADALTAWVTGDDTAVPAKRGGFMGKDWDSFVPPPAVWKECLRVLKPGGHMAVFAGARTQDLMGLSIRLAGFEIRDTLGWIYGSGFPKSLDVSKAIDKQKHDKGDMLRFCSWLRGRCADLGVSKRDLDTAAGTSDMGGWWTSNLPHRCAIPTEEQWGKIENLVGALPEWAAPLITPSRQPNENWGKREVVGSKKSGIAVPGEKGRYTVGGSSSVEVDITSAHSDAARQWEGWGTALKPAIEPIILARKPLDGTVAANVLAHGVGGLNIDASRVRAGGEYSSLNVTQGGNREMAFGMNRRTFEPAPAGRFPANVVLDEHAAKEMDKQSGALRARGNTTPTTSGGGMYGHKVVAADHGGGDSGGASRFFPVFKYQAKAPKRERPVIVREDGTKIQHPTVKPLELMKWLVRLTCPPGGTVLEPFAGSGTTVQAARDEGFDVIGIEQDPEYIELIRHRLESNPAPEASDDDPVLF